MNHCANASPDAGRCEFARSDGRRCQMLLAADHPSLCLFHAQQLRQLQKYASMPPRPDFSRELTSLSGNLTTANDVNQVLRKLFLLYAQGRIERKDAMALAYIAQLILQTIPGVKKEMNLLLNHEFWRDSIEASLGLAATNPDTNEDENNDENEDDEPAEVINTEDAPAESAQENQASPASLSANTEDQRTPTKPERRLPASRAELAEMILLRYAERNGFSIPNSP